MLAPYSLHPNIDHAKNPLCARPSPCIKRNLHCISIRIFSQSIRVATQYCRQHWKCKKPLGSWRYSCMDFRIWPTRRKIDRSSGTFFVILPLCQIRSWPTFSVLSLPLKIVISHPSFLLLLLMVNSYIAQIAQIHPLFERHLVKNFCTQDHKLL